VAEGGGWGEEFRHARAKDRGRPRRPVRQSRATQKSFLFLLEEKIGRAQIKKCEQNFSVMWRAIASGGGATLSEKRGSIVMWRWAELNRHLRYNETHHLQV